MKKQELEEKLNRIELRLSQFEVLDTLVSDFQAKKIQFDSIVSNANAQQQNIDQIPFKRAEVESLVVDSQKLKEELQQRVASFEELETKLKSLEKKINKTDNLAREQLGMISNQKLSNSFDMQSTDLIAEKLKWFKWLVASTIFLLVVIIIIVWWQTRIEDNSIFELSFLVKLTLTSPIIFFAFFINREYARSQKLLEEYQFKASVARSFEAYKEIIENSFSDQIPMSNDFNEKKIDFILETISSLYVSPMRNICENSQRGLSGKGTSSLFSNMKNVVSDAKNIVSK